jgi:anti-sigma factor RsiW
VRGRVQVGAYPNRFRRLGRWQAEQQRWLVGVLLGKPRSGRNDPHSPSMMSVASTHLHGPRFRLARRGATRPSWLASRPVCPVPRPGRSSGVVPSSYTNFFCSRAEVEAHRARSKRYAAPPVT